jgi:hypothetical protein
MTVAPNYHRGNVLCAPSRRFTKGKCRTVHESHMHKGLRVSQISGAKWKMFGLSAEDGICRMKRARLFPAEIGRDLFRASWCAAWRETNGPLLVGRIERMNP